MTAQEVYACVLNRGLRPTLGTDGRLDFGEPATLPMPGDRPPRLTPALAAAVELHRTDIARLVMSGWLPKAAKQAARSLDESVAEQRRQMADSFAPGPRLRFDRDAEDALIELYRIDYGVRVVEGKTRIFPAVRTHEFDAVWARIKPLWDRVVAHVNVPVKLLEFRRPPEQMREPAMFRLPDGAMGRGPEAFPDGVWARHLDDAGHTHPFQWHVPVTFFWWRYAGEGGWRAPWGRWVAEDRRRAVWLPWGHRD